MSQASTGKVRKEAAIDWPVIILIVFALLFWEFVLSNTDNVSHFNDVVQRLTGWNPDIHLFSPATLPRPSGILRSLLVVPGNGRGGLAYYWKHSWITTQAAIVGFLLGNAFAILTATAFLYIKPLERALMPVALALRSIPLVAITPLLLRIRFSLADLPAVQSSPLLYAIFGTEFTIKYVIVVIIVFFPTLVNVARGLVSVSAPALELMSSLNASRWHVYWKLRVPSALPLTFAAFKVAASASVLGVVVAEWLSSNQGLGYIMYQGGAGYAVAEMWVAMLLTTALAVLVYWAVERIERVVIPWHQSVIALKKVMEGTQTGLEEVAAEPGRKGER